MYVSGGSNRAELNSCTLSGNTVQRVAESRLIDACICVHACMCSQGLGRLDLEEQSLCAKAQEQH